ncbi:hypothetical protein D1BOALGB6SA_7304 [Olavius sp. associated proteobacterium Delta 1]|nr:hypothetical protein D1BOALGB6SA_7304 [Olavius sp. associated proteobacterium Delta 1]
MGKCENGNRKRKCGSRKAGNGIGRQESREKMRNNYGI